MRRSAANPTTARGGHTPHCILKTRQATKTIHQLQGSAAHSLSCVGFGAACAATLLRCGPRARHTGRIAAAAGLSLTHGTFCDVVLSSRRGSQVRARPWHATA